MTEDLTRALSEFTPRTARPPQLEPTDVSYVVEDTVVGRMLLALNDSGALVASSFVPDAAAVNMGSLRETRGAAEVASALSGGAQGARLAIVDGFAGFVWAPGGQTRGVVEFTITDGRIVAIRVTGDAERIDALDIVVLDD